MRFTYLPALTKLRRTGNRNEPVDFFKDLEMISAYSKNNLILSLCVDHTLDP